MVLIKQSCFNSQWAKVKEFGLLQFSYCEALEAMATLSTILEQHESHVNELMIKLLCHI